VSKASLSFLLADETDPPVTVVREIRVRPGREAEFEALMKAFIAEALRQPGHLGATVLRPEPQHGRDSHRFIYKFDRRSRLEAWHESETRARLFAPIGELVESDAFTAYPGLETWFELPGAGVPPRWKTTLMSWAAIYPLVVLGSYAWRATGLEAPIPVQALALTVVVVPIVAYLLAPWLGRVLHGWLHAESNR
jgi:antibiotic biosynthesis monooxygenase (ABM) superfamily enzyme